LEKKGNESCFDKKMLDTAIERGAKFVSGEVVDLIYENEYVAGIEIKDTDNNIIIARSKFVADASGQQCFLGKRGLLGPKKSTGYEKQVAFYAYAENVTRGEGSENGNTQLFYGGKDHWTWLIPFDENTTSLGAVVPLSEFKASKLDKEKFFEQCIKTINPYFFQKVEKKKLTSKVRMIANYSYKYEKLSGPGYISVGDSHGFLDPIFSFGVNFALKEGELAAQVIHESISGESNAPIANYEIRTKNARDISRMVIDTFWQYPLAFLRLTHYSHINDIAHLFSGRFFDPAVNELEAVKLMRDLFRNSQEKDAEKVA